MAGSINIRVRRDDLALIDQAAKLEGKSRSAFLRDSAERKAREVLKKPRLVRGNRK